MRAIRRALLIGVISDTHGLMRPEAKEGLRGCVAILHAGDIGNAAILDELRTLAPVTAVRGNNDRERWAASLPERRIVAQGSANILLAHDRNGLERDAVDGCDVVVTGHSHQPSVERCGGVLYLNPGSAGPRRFRLPVSVALLRLSREIEAQIVELAV